MAVFLYHMVPDPMKGKILYPLNILREKYPDLYVREVAKYTGREEVMHTRVPKLDCEWGDVLHLTPVAPDQVKHGLTAAGHIWSTSRFFKINAATISSDTAVVYTYATDGHAIPKDEIIPYSPQAIAELTALPEAAKQYYRAAAKSGESPLLYHLVPHVLIRDSLDVSNAEIIEV
jgi:hypothetical protein